MTALRDIQGDQYEVAFETYQIPAYVLDTIPERFRSDITGAVYELVDGELGEVYLTESGAPYDLRATYHEPEYWLTEDDGEAAL